MAGDAETPHIAASPAIARQRRATAFWHDFSYDTWFYIYQTD